MTSHDILPSSCVLIHLLLLLCHQVCPPSVPRYLVILLSFLKWPCELLSPTSQVSKQSSAGLYRAGSLTPEPQLRFSNPGSTSWSSGKPLKGRIPDSTSRDSEFVVLDWGLGVNGSRTNALGEATGMPAGRIARELSVTRGPLVQWNQYGGRDARGPSPAPQPWTSQID